MAELYHKWEPIADLPENYMELANPVFHSLTVKWKNARNAIRSDLFEEFKEKIKREWAVETGKVEHLYFLDDNLTKTIIGQGLNSVNISHQINGLGYTDPELLIENQYDVLDFLYKDVVQGVVLNSHFIRSMHAAFVDNQDYAPGVTLNGKRLRVPLSKGVFKKWPNNPTTPEGLIHQYCPPEQVHSEIDNLIAMHNSHVSNKVPPDIEAAWLHHRFVQIHPFQDGNGRVARGLAAMIYIEASFFPPVVTLNDKPNYLSALDAADKGDLKPFVDYLAGLVADKTLECVKFAETRENTPSSAPPPPQ